MATASYDGSTSGLVPGDFVFLQFRLANEEHVCRPPFCRLYPGCSPPGRAHPSSSDRNRAPDPVGRRRHQLIRTLIPDRVDGVGRRDPVAQPSASGRAFVWRTTRAPGWWLPGRTAPARLNWARHEFRLNTSYENECANLDRELRARRPALEVIGRLQIWVLSGQESCLGSVST